MRHVLSSTGLTLAFLLSQPAYAQSSTPSRQAPGANVPPTAANAPTNDGLQDIVVTARRTEENLRRVPVAITALSADFLESRSIQNLTQLNNYVPGIKIETFSSPDQYIISIRGQRTSLILPGLDPSVGLSVNEVPYTLTIGAGQQFYDLQSVQALKGPQGTLFGQSTTGGALLITTAKPTDKLEGSVTAGAKFFNGDHGVYGTAVLNLPVSDKLRVRIAANGIDRQGYIKNKGPVPPLVTVPTFRPNSEGAGDLQDDRQINGRLSVLFLPSDSVESLTVGSYGRLWSNGPGQHWTGYNPNSFIGPVYGGLYGFDVQKIYDDQQAQYRKNFWSTQSPINSFQRVTTWSVSNATSIDITDTLKFRNIVGYREFKRNQDIDLSGGPLNFVTPHQPLTGHELSEEAQFQGSLLDESLKYTAGFYFSKQQVDMQNGASVLTGPPADYYSHLRSRSLAVYAQATYNLTGKLSFTAGARYTWDKRKAVIDGLSVYVPGVCHITIRGVVQPADERCTLANKKSFATPTWTLSLNYQADPDTLVYLAQRRGYRSGGLSAYGTSEVLAVPFRPEKVTDVELGLKRDWNFNSGVDLRTNFAGFYSDYKRIIRNINPPAADPSVILLTNASSAKVYGGELETTLIPVRGLTLSSNIAYVHANFDSFLTGKGDASGNQFANVPRWQFTGAVNYTFPDHGNGAITIGGDYFYQSKVFFDDVEQNPLTDGPPDAVRQRGYGLINLRVDLDNIMSSPISGSLYVTNVTQTKYRTATSIQLYNGFGFSSQLPGDPRVFAAELRYKF